jgi:predicted DsbA family dithiol-disulfide isomerase
VDFNGQEVERLVEADMRLAEELGIYAVPTLVVDRRYVVQGAVHREELEMMFEQLVETGELFAALPSVTVRRLPVSR